MKKILTLLSIFLLSTSNVFASEVIVLDRDIANKPIEGYFAYELLNENGDPMPLHFNDLKQQYEFYNLPKGKYILKNIKSPKEYHPSPDVPFEILEEDTIVKITPKHIHKEEDKKEKPYRPKEKEDKEKEEKPTPPKPEEPKPQTPTEEIEPPTDEVINPTPPPPTEEIIPKNPTPNPQPKPKEVKKRLHQTNTEQTNNFTYFMMSVGAMILIGGKMMTQKKSE